MLEVSHEEFTGASPEVVWKIWSNPKSWKFWDSGLEWCKLKAGHRFEVGGEALLLPKMAPQPLSIIIVECTPNKSFTDKARFDLGEIYVSHEVRPKGNGSIIKHKLQYYEANLEAKTIFENKMWKHLQKELPASVKTLAQFATKADSLIFQNV